MSQLSEKLRYFKFIKRIRNKYIAKEIGCTEQAIKNWQNDDRVPHQIKREFAEKLVKLTSGDITMIDCGWE